MLLGTALLAVAAVVVVVMIVNGLDAPAWPRTLIVLAIVSPVLASVVFARYSHGRRSRTPSRSPPTSCPSCTSSSSSRQRSSA
jgi:hypothetical protein